MKKNKKIIIIILVVIMVIALLLGTMVPMIYGAEETQNYINTNMKMSVDLPASSIGNINELSDNAILVKVAEGIKFTFTYGDVYAGIVEDFTGSPYTEGLEEEDESIPKREDVYLKSVYTSTTWNSEEYIKQYFTDALGSGYTFSLESDTLSGLPAWLCVFQANSLNIGGYYWLTIYNGEVYSVQANIAYANYADYADVAYAIKDTYKIDNSEKYEAIVNKQSEAAVEETGTHGFLEKYGIYILIAVAVIMLAVGIVLAINKQRKARKKKSKQRYKKFVEETESIRMINEIDKK